MHRLALGDVSGNLDFLQLLTVAKPLLPHLPVEDGEFVLAILAAANSLRNSGKVLLRKPSSDPSRVSIISDLPQRVST